jgi:hypothetical protein
MVMRLNPTELCSYAIAALIVIATITVATWIVMTVWSSAPLRGTMNVGVNDNHTPLADWCRNGKSVSLPLAGAT